MQKKYVQSLNEKRNDHSGIMQRVITLKELVMLKWMKYLVYTYIRNVVLMNGIKCVYFAYDS